MVIPDLSTDRAIPSHKAWHAWHGVRAATHESLALLVSTVWSIRGLPCTAAAWPPWAWLSWQHDKRDGGREEHRIHMALGTSCCTGHQVWVKLKPHRIEPHPEWPHQWSPTNPRSLPPTCARDSPLFSLLRQLGDVSFPTESLSYSSSWPCHRQILDGRCPHTEVALNMEPSPKSLQLFS